MRIVSLTDEVSIYVHKLRVRDYDDIIFINKSSKPCIYWGSTNRTWDIRGCEIEAVDDEDDTRWHASSSKVLICRMYHSMKAYTCEDHKAR